MDPTTALRHPASPHRAAGRRRRDGLARAPRWVVAAARLLLAACDDPAASAVAGLPRPPAPASPGPGSNAAAGDRSAWLGERLRTAVDEVKFGDVIDRATRRPIRPAPNVDVSVIELDDHDRPVAAAQTLLSDAYPHGRALPVGAGLAAAPVRWHQWDAGLWRRGAAGRPDPAAKYDFVTPYPASVFKLMVAFGVFRLADQGVLTLGGTYAYRPTAPGCTAGRFSATKSVHDWLDSMLTWSDNGSTCAMLKLLHDHHGIDALNATFRDLGLATLQINGTSAADGGGWSDAITMTSLDTARLLLIAGGGAGELWRAPNGRPVTADVLSPVSRQAFLGFLNDQGLNQALSTANYCGAGYPAAGIPQRVPERWINRGDGSANVHGHDYQHRDVRPCNARAQVTFAHKTGLVDDADAGVVTSLPGAPRRRYVVAVFTNLGSSYGDAVTPGCTSDCAVGHAYYSEKFAQLGARIDGLMTSPAPR